MRDGERNKLKGEGRNVSYDMSRDRKLDPSCEIVEGGGLNLTGTRRKKFPQNTHS